MPSNALCHLPSTYLSILMQCPLTASSFDPLTTKNWEHIPSFCQFPNEFLTWLSKPSKISLPLASSSTLTSHSWLWKISFSGIHLFLQICSCLHTWKMRWTVHVPTDFPYWTVNSLKARTIPHNTVVSKEWCLIYIFEINTADPWTTQLWTAQVHLHTDFVQYLYYFWPMVGRLRM